MKLTDMHISNPETSLVANEGDILDELLQLNGAKVLELGCGKAEKTRLVARKAVRRKFRPPILLMTSC